MNTININHRAEKLHRKLHRHAKHHVHRLRGKSDIHKKVFAFSFAFIVTSTVFMLWYFLSLPKILDTYKITKSENKRLNEDPVNEFKDIFKAKETDTGIDVDNINIDTDTYNNNIEITQ